MRYSIIVVLSVFLFLLSYLVQAQPPTVKFTPNTNQMMIGDALIISIEASCERTIEFKWPTLSDSLGKMEITAVSFPDTTKAENGRLIITQTLTLTAFEAGDYVIPTQVFSYRDSKTGQGGVLRTNMLNIAVREPEIDPEGDIKDIAPIIELPLTFWERFYPYLLGIVLLAALSFLFYWLRKRQKQKPLTIKYEPPPLPPHLIAFNRLQQLEKAKYWQQGKEKQYYSELTDVLRQYIENRYNIQALELTTDETIAAFKKIAIDGSALDKLNQLMKLADLVKFAKAQPTVEQHLQAFTDAEVFVQQTKQREEIIETPVQTI